MDIKNILIHLDHSKGCRNRLTAGFDLAQRFDAKLEGLFIVPDYVIPSYIEAQISVDLMSEVTEQAVARARETLATYQQLADDARVDFQGHVVEGPVIPILSEHSKYADLLLLGQDDPDDADNASYGLADALLFDGSCACLIVPHSGEVLPPGKRVLLAWNASRESAHALKVALPILQQADEVVALSSEPKQARVSMAKGHPHADELMHYLETHGVEGISSGMNGSDLTPSEAIVEQAENMDADLIVMGAYGHTRLREIILGGVTHDLLKTAPVPLLLAH